MRRFRLRLLPALFALLEGCNGRGAGGARGAASPILFSLLPSTAALRADIAAANGTGTPCAFKT